MTEAAIFDVLRQGLWVATMISAPLLAVALVVGVAIGLLQALTSVQEMTLTFVPKMLVLFVGMLLLMPFMLSVLRGFTLEIFDRIVAIGS